ncbi:short-chain dehydrogenase reductase [Fusarium denticulatum]|uniref:Short-chain dehydrogenase reductase n=1 Tax=Fusarium denticulatum TaxID=48507 RepID=A0A8H6CWR9_9HYPO|nr:short-chain dehydrogenase reductase [Fusarium denticulatum]
MPTFGDITQFLGGQIFGRTTLPDVDLSGKTMIVTGANTGLGLEAAKHLGDKAASVIYDETNCQNQTEIQVWELDLADYKSTFSFAKRVVEELPRLDGFLANAGVEVERFELAGDLELTLKVNVISTFFLALGVLPKLQETSEKYETDTTMTIVGSLIHNFAPDDQLDIGKEKDIFVELSRPEIADMAQRYPLSKLMSHQCARQLAKHVSATAKQGRTHVTINWANPGWCATSLVRSKKKSLPELALMPLIGWTAEYGSRTLVYALTAGKETHGCYLSESQVKQESSYVRSSKGQEIAQRLWDDLITRLREVRPER